MILEYHLCSVSLIFCSTSVLQSWMQSYSRGNNINNRTKNVGFVCHITLKYIQCNIWMHITTDFEAGGLKKQRATPGSTPVTYKLEKEAINHTGLPKLDTKRLDKHCLTWWVSVSSRCCSWKCQWLSSFCSTLSYRNRTDSLFWAHQICQSCLFIFVQKPHNLLSCRIQKHQFSGLLTNCSSKGVCTSVCQKSSRYSYLQRTVEISFFEKQTIQ